LKPQRLCRPVARLRVRSQRFAMLGQTSQLPVDLGFQQRQVRVQRCGFKEQMGLRVGELHGAPRIGGLGHPRRHRKTPMKIYDVEVQRLKSARHEKGMIELGTDLVVQPRAYRDDEAMPTSVVRLPVEHARTLLILLKQQIAELDKLNPRSRRTGRC